MSVQDAGSRESNRDPGRLQRTPARSRPGRAGRKEARSGRPRAGHAPNQATPPAPAEAGPASPAALFPLAAGASCIFMTEAWPGPGTAELRPPAADPAPAGRPWLPPRGGSFHLVTTQKCVAPAPPPPHTGPGVSPPWEEWGWGGDWGGRIPPPWGRSLGMEG